MGQTVRQVGLESESLETARAAEPLGTGVRLDVGSQVGPVGERFAAQCARKRFLSGMRALVSAKQPRPRERLVARRTAVLEIVGEKMHRQRRHRDVDLTAVSSLN